MRSKADCLSHGDEWLRVDLSTGEAGPLPSPKRMGTQAQLNSDGTMLVWERGWGTIYIVDLSERQVLLSKGGECGVTWLPRPEAGTKA